MDRPHPLIRKLCGLIAVSAKINVHKIRVFYNIELNQTIITLEEHSIVGGLGSIISDVAATLAHATVKKLGIQDRFSEYCGSYEYLLNEHKIDFDSLKDAIKHHVPSLD